METSGCGSRWLTSFRPLGCGPICPWLKTQSLVGRWRGPGDTVLASPSLCGPGDPTVKPRGPCSSGHTTLLVGPCGVCLKCQVVWLGTWSLACPPEACTAFQPKSAARTCRCGSGCSQGAARWGLWGLGRASGWGSWPAQGHLALCPTRSGAVQSSTRRALSQEGRERCSGPQACPFTLWLPGPHPTHGGCLLPGRWEALMEEPWQAGRELLGQVF